MYHVNKAMDQTVKLRPELISLRRKMLSFSQTELAKKMGVTQGTLSKIEQGIRDCPDSLIEKMGQALDCPVSFFYQTEREYGPPMSAHPMFRKKASTGQKVIDQIIAEMNVRIGHIRKLLNSVDFEPELPLPQYEVSDFDGDVEEIAANVRRAWYVPRGPIKSLAEYMERAGCLIVPCDMHASQIDGISYRIPGIPPVIFINNKQSADRMRFSLAHELGHIIMHSYPDPEMEMQANNFAAALLMPKSDIAPELIGLTLEKAAYMKPVWKVSMAALIVRATTLKKIDKNKAEYLWRQMSSKGFRTREPVYLDFERETPSLLDALIENMTKNLGYTDLDLENTMNLFYSEIEDMYSLPKKSGLRVVK